MYKQKGKSNMDGNRRGERSVGENSNSLSKVYAARKEKKEQGRVSF